MIPPALHESKEVPFATPQPLLAGQLAQRKDHAPTTAILEPFSTKARTPRNPHRERALHCGSSVIYRRGRACSKRTHESRPGQRPRSAITNTTEAFRTPSSCQQPTSGTLARRYDDVLLGRTNRARNREGLHAVAVRCSAWFGLDRARLNSRRRLRFRWPFPFQHVVSCRAFAQRQPGHHPTAEIDLGV
jgi:hypothetical protein